MGQPELAGALRSPSPRAGTPDGILVDRVQCEWPGAGVGRPARHDGTRRGRLGRSGWQGSLSGRPADGAVADRPARHRILTPAAENGATDDLETHIPADVIRCSRSEEHTSELQSREK